MQGCYVLKNFIDLPCSHPLLRGNARQGIKFVHMTGGKHVKRVERVKKGSLHEDQTLSDLIILPVDNGPLSAGKSIEEEEFMIT